MKDTTPCVSSGNHGGNHVGALLGSHTMHTDTQACTYVHTCTCASTLAPLPDSWSRCAHGIGSLWDPNITVETLEAHQLRLSFTPWNESTSYQVLLHSFPPAENQSCFQHVVDMPVVTALSAAFLNHQPGSEHPLHP